MKLRLLLVLCLVFAALVTTAGAATLDTGAKTGAGQSPVTLQVQELQDIMMADKAIVAQILQLQDIPEVQALLGDPEIIRAVAEGDIDALTGNPAFLQLLNHPRIQEIQKRVKP